MTKINVHEAQNGRWYCSTTYNGYDYFEEGRTIEEAKENMEYAMKDLGVNKSQLLFGEPVYYPHEPKHIPSNIGLRERPRGIDNNPFA